MTLNHAQRRLLDRVHAQRGHQDDVADALRLGEVNDRIQFLRCLGVQRWCDQHQTVHALHGDRVRGPVFIREAHRLDAGVGGEFAQVASRRPNVNAAGFQSGNHRATEVSSGSGDQDSFHAGKGSVGCRRGQDGTFLILGMLEVPDSILANAKDCPIRNVLDQVGNKWSLLVMLSLRGRRRRFMEVKRSIGDITQRVLTQTLRSLERDGYVAREAQPTVPPTVEYWLTPLGESLLRPMGKLVAWANEHFDEVMDSRKRFDATSSAQTRASTSRPASHAGGSAGTHGGASGAMSSPRPVPRSKPRPLPSLA